MADERALSALARSMGVVVEYPDASGTMHRCEDANWVSPLPPVMVLQHPAQSIKVRISLPESRLDQRLRWRLVEELGQQHSGNFRPQTLRQIEQRTIGDVSHVAVELVIAETLPPGYHRLELTQGKKSLGSMPLILAPRTCYEPDAVREGRRVWGPSVQLYAIRSERNWGIGDVGDLRHLLELFADLGADVVGLSPLHALFFGNPDHTNPHRPSSRLFLNPLYIDVEAVPEHGESAEAQKLARSPEFHARLQTLRAAETVDYAGVTAAKREVFELLYRHFCEEHLEAGTARARAFRAYQSTGGRALRLFALFEALWEHFHAENANVLGWLQWPAAYRHPENAAVRAFEQAHMERIEFFEYLQWLADQQFFALGERSVELGLGVGLCLTLAASVDRNGADAWAEQECYALDMSIGAPPDGANPRGQDWELLPTHPHRLRDRGYAPFIAALHGLIRDAGALRVQHITGLVRQFWVPRGCEVAQGAYVENKFDELFGILALESVRNRCLIVGEDLGIVPEAVHDAMRRLGILSYRPLFFAKTTAGEYAPVPQFPRDAMVAIARFDMPTLAGFWQGQDLTLRSQLGLFDSDSLRETQVVERSQDRARLLLALEREALLPPTMTVNPISAPAMTSEFSRSVHVFLARTPAKVMLVRAEDVFAVMDQCYLPGSADEAYPNWRRKLPPVLEAWARYEPLSELASALCEAREVLPRPMRERATVSVSIPRATYRLQLNGGYTIRDAIVIVPYLARLGVSHVYCSPYLKARAGSQHGYDIIDHNAVNPEIGSNADFERFSKTLAGHDIGQMIDVVPNHMGVMGSDNAWWLDVLENGPAAAHAQFFDIDWEPLKSELRGKVLLPVLGEQYGRILEKAELKLVFDAERGEFSVFYYEHRFPIDPREYPTILHRRGERLKSWLGTETYVEPEFLSLITAFGHLPARNETSEAKVIERSRDKEVHKRHLAEICRRSSQLAAYIAGNVAEFNGTPGNPESFDALHELIQAQAWRLAYWRVASDEINYRRFFDINDLAALRMENKVVFDETHRLILDLVAQGKVHCLRIDHPDGLYDPAQYFHRLQEPFLGVGVSRETGTAKERPPRPLYVVVEKIAASYERVPDSWAVYGTTGYRFANVVNGLFVDSTAEAKMERIYRGFAGEVPNFEDLLYRSKRLIVRTALAGELNVLANQLGRIAEASRGTSDFTLNGLRDALTEIVASFPVYRTYVSPTSVSDDDRRYIDWAVAAAKKRSRAADISVFDFVRDVLTTQCAEGRSDAYRTMVLAFSIKFQQFSAPVMAKGTEDTSFYIYNRLASLNEVGGEPRTFGISVAAFHGASLDRCRNWPHTMLATSTHDTKRSEDVRARIDVLSELPALWRLMLRRWSRINRSRKREVDGKPAPSANDEYLLYQALLGAWPLIEPDESELADLCARIQRYMLKAVREAKVYTSWINPDSAYEDALSGFVGALLTSSRRNRFLTEFIPVARRVARFGMLNSLSQTLIKLTSPGVPDIYQGTELWDFSLVDPDNRRPVNYGARDALLRDLEVRMSHDASSERAAEVRGLLNSMPDGRVKLYVVWRALDVRRRHERVFREGEYVPLAALGPCSDHLCAFARRLEDEAVVVIVPRLYARLLGDRDELPVGEEIWGETEVSLGALAKLASSMTNEFTGESCPVQEDNGKASLRAADVLRGFPIALLTLGTNTHGQEASKEEAQ